MLGELSGGSSKPSLPCLVTVYGSLKTVRIKVRPKHARKVKLGVGKLPKHEVTHALLSARANKKIGFWQIGQGQIGGFF